MRARQAVALPVLLLLLLLPLLASASAEPAASASAASGRAAAAPPTVAGDGEQTAAPGAEAAPEPEASAAAPLPALPAEIDDAILHLVHSMEEAEKSLTRMQDLGDDIGRLRDEVERVIARTTEVADGLRPRLTEVKSQIDRLGPPPGKDAPPEAAAVAAERARLHAEASALDGAIKTLELTWVRARQTIDKITDLRLAIFTRSLMERMASPLLPSLWVDVARDAPPLARLLGYISSDWWNAVERRLSGVLLLLAGAVVLYAGGRAIAGRVTRPAPGEACATRTFFERAAAAAWIAPLRTLPAVLAALVVYGGLDSLGLLYYPSASIAAAVLRAVLIFAAVATLIAAVLAPHEAQRRLVSLSDRSARRICRYLQAMTLVYAADLALTSIGRALYVPLSISVVQSLAASIAFAGLLVGLCLTPFEPYGAPSEAAVSRARPRWLKVPLWAAALGIIVACVLGYVALGRFAAQQLEMTGVIGLAATLLFLAIRAFTREPSEAPHPVGVLLERRFGLDAPRRQQLARLTEFALTLTLGILALPLFMLQWGFSGDDIRDWLKAALFGFEIGQFRISLARILIGVVLFTALLFATRLVQRWLRDNVLSTRTDPGIANSIDTAVGYAGIGVAALLSVSYAGFDVTNLAIVAGALSVGIGFGLQSIVNNFVSGLILLIERPIKVGDWIVVGNEQGNVRRISVRSTEIETFDRASLIVPNSELIAGRVLNWTHRNSVGRLVLKFNVGYSADARKVAAILLECARRHPSVMRTPAPKAVLEGLAEKWLEFSLRVYLADINEALDVQSELRMAALEALRAAWVDIPGAQPAPTAAVPAAAGAELVRRAAVEPIEDRLAGAPGGAARVPELVRDKS